MTETRRAKLNYDRLQWLHSSIRNKVHAVLTDLEGHGLKPLIASSTYRTPAQQRKLKRQGRSKLSWGFHCATKNGKPCALAADIVDANKGWGASFKFWMMLGSSATAHGMEWGGFWGLPKALRHELKRAWLYKRWERRKIGWDPAHIQTKNWTVREARRAFGG